MPASCDQRVALPAARAAAAAERPREGAGQRRGNHGFSAAMTEAHAHLERRLGTALVATG